MEPQTLLVAAVFIIITAILAYLISVFGIREKSFDEAMADQKRRQEEEYLKTKSEKKSEKDSKKKWGRKKVEKTKSGQVYSQTETVIESSQVKQSKILQYEPEPEIIDPTDFPIKEHKSKSKNKTKTKPILINKEEVAPVAKEMEAPHLYHRSNTPKDELELKHKTPIEEKKVREEKIVKQETSKVSESSVKVQEEIVVTSELQTSASFVNSSMMKSSEKKKTKTHPGSGDAESPMTTSRLISSVRSATMTDAEAQAMINILLNKQQGSTASSIETWSKKSQKGDPVALLRKQLEEKERSLQEEQQLAMAANNKLKELRQEMNQEKTRHSAHEKNSLEKITMHTKEIQALHDRMQKTHEAHKVEKSSLQARVSTMENQMGPGNQNLLQKLTDENKQLKDSLTKIQSESIPASDMKSLTQKVHILETELSNSHIKLNAAENSKKTLQDKVSKYEEQLRSVETGQKDTESVLSKRLDDVNHQLKKTEGQKTNLNSEMQKAQNECQALKSQLKELERTLTGANENTKGLQAKLEDSEQRKTTLETSIQTLEQKLDDSRREKSEKETELKKLRVENRDLSDQLRKENERQQGEGQEEPSQPDGAPNGHINHDSTSEKNAFHLKEQEKLLSEKEKEISRLNNDLTSKSDEINRLFQEVEKQKKKNNEIREKNWKAMEALDKAEKSLEEKIGKAVKTAVEKDTSECEIYDQSVLKRIFPKISVSSSLNHKDWMKSFESEAVTYVTTISTKSSQPAVDPVEAQKLHGAFQRTEELEKRLQEEENKYSKVTSQLEIAEKSLSHANSRLNEAESRTHDLKQRLSEEESLTSSACQRLQDAENQRKTVEDKLIVITREKNTVESRLKVIQVELKECTSGSSQHSDLESRLLQTEEQRDRLEAQVKEYRNLLSETGDKLEQLERSVESEEHNWRSRSQSAETELAKTKEELNFIQEEYRKTAGNNEDLDHLGFTYRCVEKSLKTIVEEMEEKIVLLEAELKASELKHTSVQEELTEAQTNISTLQVQLSDSQKSSSNSNLDNTVDSLQQQLETVNNEKKEAELRVIEIEKQLGSLQVQVNQGGMSDFDISALKKLIADLQSQLEVEKKKNKEISSKVVWLNGTVKIGQDALAEEQRLVKQLQDQLQLKNGTGPEDPDSLKAKLLDTQKQLEREIMANRQLSQKMGASAGNDVGTSV